MEETGAVTTRKTARTFKEQCTHSSFLGTGCLSAHSRKTARTFKEQRTHSSFLDPGCLSAHSRTTPRQHERLESSALTVPSLVLDVFPHVAERHKCEWPRVGAWAIDQAHGRPVLFGRILAGGKDLLSTLAKVAELVSVVKPRFLFQQVYLMTCSHTKLRK